MFAVYLRQSDAETTLGLLFPASVGIAAGFGTFYGSDPVKTPAAINHSTFDALRCGKPSPDWASGGLNRRLAKPLRDSGFRRWVSCVR